MKDHGTGLERELWRSALDDGPRPEAWERLVATMAKDASRRGVVQSGAVREHRRARLGSLRLRVGVLRRYGTAVAAAAALLVGGVAAARALGLWPSTSSDSKHDRGPGCERSECSADPSKPVEPAVTASATAEAIAVGDARFAAQGPSFASGTGVPTPAIVSDSAGGARTLIELVRATNRVGPENSMGIEGNWYSDGDGVSCPSVDPCGENGCCMQGRTRKDPTFRAWGCVVGLELSAPTGGWAHEKHPYAGPAKGFDVQIEGTPEGLPLRILLTQEAYPIRTVSPMVEIPGPGRFHVRFDDAMYPTWCRENKQCRAPSGQRAAASSTYDIQIQVVGGLADADFNVCVKSLSPFE
jgi:hypothetical protein